MGIENMRRWPMYIVFAVCILLTLSLFNSWSLETELRNRITEISVQLQDCSKQQSSCMEDSLSLLEQKEGYVSKVNELEKQKLKLGDDAREYRDKASKAESRVNRTLIDVELCKTELQSLKNLQLSKSATLETLRLEKETLTQQLSERKQKIEDLEKEVERLKAALTTKSAPVPPAPSKVTPAAALPKISPAINSNNNPVNNVLKSPIQENNVIPENNQANPDNNQLPENFQENPIQDRVNAESAVQRNPVHEPVLDNNNENNDAKEDLEDTNAVNDGDPFDVQVNK